MHGVIKRSYLGKFVQFITIIQHDFFNGREFNREIIIHTK